MLRHNFLIFPFSFSLSFLSRPVLFFLSIIVSYSVSNISDPAQKLNQSKEMKHFAFMYKQKQLDLFLLLVVGVHYSTSSASSSSSKSALTRARSNTNSNLRSPQFSNNRERDFSVPPKRGNSKHLNNEDGFILADLNDDGQYDDDEDDDDDFVVLNLSDFFLGREYRE